MNNKCCDNCTYYVWYWDKCNKWNCEVDDRSCCSEFIPNKLFSDEYLLHKESQESLHRTVSSEFYID